MYVSKAERRRVYEMFGGRCAYCGCDLPPRWHVDHVEPVVRYPEGGFYGNPMVTMHPERHTAGNFMPSCAPCNIDKGSHRVDSWRIALGQKLNALQKTPAWRLLKAHGQLEATGDPIVFLFERLRADSPSEARKTGEP